jgi:RNA recognition motif-containing protein
MKSQPKQTKPQPDSKDKKPKVTSTPQEESHEQPSLGKREQKTNPSPRDNDQVQKKSAQSNPDSSAKKIKSETQFPQDHEVFVGNLPFRATERDLKEFFSACGKITIAKIVYNKENKSRGRGFVKFVSPEGVANALKLNNNIFMDKPIIVDEVKTYDNLFKNPELNATENPNLHVNKIVKDFTPKQSEFSNVESQTLLIRNLDYSITEDDLTKVFAKCPGVKRTRIIRRNNGMSKGYGFVDFDTVENARAGLANEGHILKGRRMTIEFSAPKSVRYEGKEPSEVRPQSGHGRIEEGQAGSRPVTKKGFITKFEGNVVDL